MNSQIIGNKIKTYGFMLVYAGLLILLFNSLANLAGESYASTVLFAGIIFSLISIISAYISGDRLLLSMSKAKPADPRRDKYILDVVEGLSAANRIPLPKVFIIETETPNAFATGRNPANSSLAVTRGLISILNREELEGVLAHELSHIRNYDTLYATIVSVLAGAIVMAAYSMRWFAFGSRRSSSKRNSGASGQNALIMLISIVFIILAPIFAKLVQLAISRKREYLADATAARMLGYPLGLASALEKLNRLNDPSVSRNSEMLGNNALAGLYIVNPLKSSGIQNLFSTHPPIEKRVSILRKM